MSVCQQESVKAEMVQRVLHVFKSYFPETHGGIEEVIHELCCDTVERGGEAHVLALGGYSETFRTQQGYNVHRFKQAYGTSAVPMSFAAILGFRDLLSKVDVVHYHYPYPFCDVLHILFGQSTPAVVTYHSDLVKRYYIPLLYAPLGNYFLSKVRFVVATSKNYVASSNVLKKIPSKVRVIPLGIDHNRYDQVDEMLCVKYERDYGSPFVLYLGAIRNYKGLNDLLKAAEQVDFNIVIAGGGPLMGVIEHEIRARCIQNIVLTGRVTHQEKCSLFRACHAVVLPSNMRSEAFGISLVEGALFGKPLISTSLSTGTSYVNLDGVTGIVVKPSEPSLLAKAMTELVEDQELANKFGKNARRRFDLLFRATVMSDSYHALYYEMTKHSKPLLRT